MSEEKKKLPRRNLKFDYEPTSDVERGIKKKLLKVYASDKLIADFKIRMQYEELKYSPFLRWIMIKGVLQEQVFDDLLEIYREEKSILSEANEERKKELKKRLRKNKKDFRLDESDLESIFDMIGDRFEH